MCDTHAWHCCGDDVAFHIDGGPTVTLNPSEARTLAQQLVRAANNATEQVNKIVELELEPIVEHILQTCADRSGEAFEEVAKQMLLHGINTYRLENTNTRPTGECSNG